MTMNNTIKHVFISYANLMALTMLFILPLRVRAIDDNINNIACGSGVCDGSPSSCLGFGGYQWTADGYPGSNAPACTVGAGCPSCCGDDSQEFYTSTLCPGVTGITPRCCANAGNKIDASGACVATCPTDAISPSILTLSAAGIPRPTISWSVSDTGGSGLSFVQVWRANLGSYASCSVVPGTDFQQMPLGSPQNFSPGATGVSSWQEPADLPTGIYCYGLHVNDNAGNFSVETPAQRPQIAVGTIDLTIIEPPTAPVNICLGNTLNLSTTVRNIGTLPSGPSTFVVYHHNVSTWLCNGATNPQSIPPSNGFLTNYECTITPVSAGTLNITATVSGGGDASAANNVSPVRTVTVQDCALPPTVTIAATDNQAAEATPVTNTATFTITRTDPTINAITVNLNWGNTSAVLGTDYTVNLAPVATSVTIPAGARDAVITLTPINDTVVDPNETASLTLASGTGYTVGTPANAIVTIVDNDIPPADLTGIPNAPGTVSVGIPVTFSGTVANNGGTDAGGTVARFCIYPGSSNPNPIQNCLLDAVGSVGPTSAVGSILASQASPSINASTAWTPTATGPHALYLCADAGQSIAESNEGNNCGSPTVFTVNPPPAYSLSINKTGAGTGTVTSDVGSINCGGTCSAIYNSGTNVRLTAVADTGSSFTGWSGGGCTGITPCTIAVNSNLTVTANFAALPVVTIAATDGQAAETNVGQPQNTGTIQLTRSGATASPLQVYVMITGTAGLGGDYSISPTLTGVAGNIYLVTLSAGAAITSLTIAPINDTIVEPPEDVVLTVNPGGGYVISASPSDYAVVNIADNPCGNNIIDAGESCDGTNLGGKKCKDIGTFNSGTLSCYPPGAAGQCNFNTSLCSYKEKLCAGDINDDGFIDIVDLGFILNQWGTAGNAGADINPDGTVDINDYVIWLACYITHASTVPLTTPFAPAKVISTPSI